MYDAIGAFHAQLSVCNGIVALAITLASVSFVQQERFPFLFSAARFLAVGLLVYLIWYIVTAERQLTRALRSLRAPSALSLKEAMTWRNSAWVVVSLASICLFIVLFETAGVSVKSLFLNAI